LLRQILRHAILTIISNFDIMAYSEWPQQV